MPPDIASRMREGRSLSNQIYDRHSRLTPLGKAMVRSDILRQAVTAQLSDDNIVLRTVVVYSYHSGLGSQGSGTPFVTVGFIVCHETQAEIIDDAMMDLGCFFRYEQLPTDLGIRGLKHCALDLLAHRSTKEAAQILDIRPGTVAAWKAHDTMGTYRDEISEMAENYIGFTSFVGQGECKSCSYGWGRTSLKVHRPRSSEQVMHDMERRRVARMSGAGRYELQGGE